MARSLKRKLDSITLPESVGAEQVTEEKNQNIKPDEADLDIQQPDHSGDTKSTKEEIGGPKGPEPTRYGDWERKGRCIDF